MQLHTGSWNCFSVCTHLILIVFLTILIAYLRKYTAYLDCWCLVEKSYCIIPDDVARTLKEGRFWSQVKKMVAWKKDFTTQGVDCSLHYILEREPEDYVVQCADGCQGVGKCGNPTLRQVKV